MIKLVGSTPLPTEYGDWTYMVFKEEPAGKFHTLMVHKRPDDIRDKPDNVLVRVHSSCATSELFHAINCECREELEEAMYRIQAEGRGAVVYLDQEAAGSGIEAKIKAYSMAFDWADGKIVQTMDPESGKEVSIYSAYEKLGYRSENRSFEVAAEMLKSIGVRGVRLLTNNPKKVDGLISSGLKAVPESIHIKPKNEIVSRHLKDKAEILGHNISDEDLG